MGKLRLRKNKWLIQGHTGDTQMAELGQKSRSSALFHVKPWLYYYNIKLLTCEMLFKIFKIKIFFTSASTVE